MTYVLGLTVSPGCTGGGGRPDGSSGATGAVRFSVPSQAFQGELRVAMSTELPNAEIRYTVDRSRPVPGSTLYSGEALTITQTTQLRAQTFVGGAAAGAIGTALYIARDFDARSDIPLLILDGYGLGQSTNKDVWLDAAVMVFEPVNGEAKLSALPSMADRAGYHIRGSSSARFPQKSYRLELRDDFDGDLDRALLGMPAESDWVLVAPYYDRALIRNPFVYELGRDMGLVAPRVRYAEVYINYAARPLQASDYVGIYYVSENIKNSKNRLDLAQLTAKDTALPAISGGYIMKFDWAVAEQPTIPCTGSPLANSSGGGHCFSDLEVVDPDPLGDEQKAFLTGYIQAFHDGLHAPVLADYGATIDVTSFIDNFLINELVKNIDEFTRSAYYHKDRNGKHKAGPLWDYNFALDCGRSTNRDPQGWQYVQASSEPGRVRVGASDWYPRLTADPAFMAQVATRWKELRGGLFSQAALDQRISDLALPLVNAAPRDIARWPVSSVFSSQQSYTGPTAATWEGQVQAIRDWLPQRLAWLDAQLP